MKYDFMQYDLSEEKTTGTDENNIRAMTQYNNLITDLKAVLTFNFKRLPKDVIRATAIKAEVYNKFKTIVLSLNENHFKATTKTGLYSLLLKEFKEKESKDIKDLIQHRIKMFISESGLRYKISKYYFKRWKLNDYGELKLIPSVSYVRTLQ